MSNNFSKRLNDSVSEFKEAIKKDNINNLVQVCLEIRSLLSLTKDISLMKEDKEYTLSEFSEIIEQVNLFAVLLTELRNNLKSSQLDDVNGIQIFLNSVLPIDWNIYSDCLIIDKQVKNAQKIAEQARKLGQKYIFGNFSSPYIEKILINSNTQVDDILSNKTQQCICIYDTDNYCQNLFKFYETLKDRLMNEQMYERTLDKLQLKYVDRMIENIDKFLLSEPVNNIKAILEGQDILIISPGPSLKTNIELIKKCRTSYIIIAVAQACPLLSLYNVCPDYIIVVDALDYSTSLKNIDINNVNGLIVSTQVHRAFLTLGFKNVYFWESSNSIYNFNQFFGVEFINFGGGSVSVNALSLSIFCNPRSITIVGQDLVLGESSKYAEGISYNDTGEAAPLNRFEEINNIKFLCYEDGSMIRLFDVLCVDGKIRHAPQDYYFYLNQIEMLVSKTHIELINISDQGAVIEGFSQGTLVDKDSDVSLKVSLSSRINGHEYIDFLELKQVNLYRIQSVLNDLVFYLNSSEIYLDEVSEYEEKLRNLLKYSPEVNNFVAPSLKKFDRLALNAVEQDLETNKNFSLLLYDEILSKVNKLIDVNFYLVEKVTLDLDISNI